MIPTLRQLQVFRTVVEQGSFRKSSEVLNTSQPALSNTVKTMEETLGTPVFLRTTRSVELTAAGQTLYSHVQKIFDMVEIATLEARDAADGRVGRLRMTYVDFAILGGLPDILEEFRIDNPKVQFNISFARTLDQIEMMQNGQADIGFIFDLDTPLAPGYRKEVFNVEGLAAVVPRTHQLAKRTTIELSELEGEPIIAGDARWERYTGLVNEHCIMRGFVLDIQQRAYLRDEMLSLALGGLGVLIYPACIINASRFGLRAIPISDVPEIITTSFIWREDTQNPLVEPFVDKILNSGKSTN